MIAWVALAIASLAVLSIASVVAAIFFTWKRIRPSVAPVIAMLAPPKK